MATSIFPIKRSTTIFTLFAKLPSELRLKIWSLVIPGPRNVSIKYHLEREKPSMIPHTTWRSSTPVPIILHINRESRAEGLKTLSLAFTSIYVNFAQDTLVLGDGSGDEPISYPLLDILLGGDFEGANDLEKIQRLALDIHEENYGRSTFIWGEILQFPVLKELTLYVWEEDSMRTIIRNTLRGFLGSVAKRHPEWIIPKIEIKTNWGGYWGRLTLED